MGHRAESKFHDLLPESFKEFWEYQWHGHWTREAFTAHFLGGLIGLPILAVYFGLEPVMALKVTIFLLAWWEIRNLEIWNSTKAWKMASDIVAGAIGAGLAYGAMTLLG